MSLSIIRELTDNMLPDVGGNLLTDAKREEAVQRAVDEYSRDKPNLSDDLLTGVSGTDEPLMFPTSQTSDWVDGFSTIEEVEYPILNEPRSFIIPHDAVKLLFEDGEWWFETQFELDANESMRIVFTSLHTASSIPAHDQEPVAALAASFLARQMASFFAEHTDSTLADNVDRQQQQEQFSALAEEFRQAYIDKIVGRKEGRGGQRSRLKLIDVDVRPLRGRADFFWNRRRLR